MFLVEFEKIFLLKGFLNFKVFFVGLDLVEFVFELLVVFTILIFVGMLFLGIVLRVFENIWLVGGMVVFFDL